MTSVLKAHATHGAMSDELPISVLQLCSIATGKDQRRGAGGPEVRFAASLPIWDQNRFRIFVAYSTEGILVERFRDYEDWIDFSITSKERLRGFRTLIRLVQDNQIDIIHSQGPLYTDFVATLAARITGKRVIITRAVQASDLRYGFFKNIALRTLDKVTKALANRFIAICEDGRHTLIEEGCSTKNIDLVYNGVDTERFHPCAPSKLPSQGSFRIGMFAQMVPHKRHDLLVRAMHIAYQAGKEWELFLVGDGPTRDDIQCLVDQLELRETVHLLGFQQDLPGFYTSIDLAALISDREGLPVSLIEAMACERPFIASDVGGTAELASGGSAGVLVAPSVSERVLFEQMDRLDNRRDERESMGKTGRRIVEEKYSLPQMVRGYEQSYLQALKS